MPERGEVWLVDFGITQKDLRFIASVRGVGILYPIERDYVLIVPVAHCSRKPGYWKHRRSQ